MTKKNDRAGYDESWTKRWDVQEGAGPSQYVTRAIPETVLCCGHVGRFVTPAVKQTKGIGKGTPGPGRKKGVPNKTTASVKQALTIAFEGIGGVSKLQAWATEHPTEFYGLWAKLLPKEVEVAGKDGSPLQVFVFGGQKVTF